LSFVVSVIVYHIALGVLPMDKFGVGNCFGMWSRNVMREVAAIENEKGMRFDLRLAMKISLDMKTVP
jgi:hypothetical protein